MGGFVPVQGGSLYTEADGDGPAILLIHAGVANLRMWDPHVPALSRHYRVIRYDSRGFGRSESEHVEFTNRADAVAILDHLEIDRALLVGVSRAGSIALDTALEYPNRVAGLMSVAGGVGGYRPEGVPDDSALWDEVDRRWKNKEWEWLADFETRYWVDGPGQPEDRVDPVVRALVHGWILETYRAEKEEGIHRALDPPAASRFGELTCPVQVVVGALDEGATVASGHHLASSVPQARLEVFENAAHMLALEEPDRFTRVLLDFAASVFN